VDDTVAAPPRACLHSSTSQGQWDLRVREHGGPTLTLCVRGVLSFPLSPSGYLPRPFKYLSKSEILDIPLVSG
jgi:hypothetical protein